MDGKKDKNEEQIQDAVNTQYIARYLEEEYNRVTAKNFVEKIPIFADFLEYRRIGIYKVAIFESKEVENLFLLFLYTEKHEYRIYVTPTHIGAGSSCRYHRPLENWTRGHDLTDGPCTAETLNNVILDILSDELVQIDS